MSFFYQQTKFRCYNSIRGSDINVSAFEKQTSAIFEVYFRFRFRPYRRSRRKFNQIGLPMAEHDVLSIFQMADLRHFGF